MKILVAVLATLAAMAIAVHLVGNTTLSQTAVTLPATQHTHAFGISWYLIVGLVVGGGVWHIVKGK